MARTFGKRGRSYGQGSLLTRAAKGSTGGKDVTKKEETFSVSFKRGLQINGGGRIFIYFLFTVNDKMRSRL